MGNMRRAVWIAALVLLCWSCAGRGGGREKISTPLDPSGQCLLVLSEGWGSTEGTLQAFGRSWTGNWKAVGPGISVYLGRSGLGWGRGLHPEQTDGPRKAEGDGRAPAGIFALPTAFGRALPAPPLKSFPFLVLDQDTVCVDDSVSRHYNQVFGARDVPARDWDSSEGMLRPDGLYDLGLLVDHNPKPAEPEGGSCIFVHLPHSPLKPTTGCTTVPREDMERLLRWLDASKRPVIVQLPRVEYARLKAAWGLP